ncbi:MAG: XRE family transcriptional regulator [Paludibacter sp.]|nr:XRE family transcriptional regulator [Paludibacter sp.]
MKRIGERIKRKREQLSLQLNELAKKVGISSSALSQIENAKAFPTIVTLKHIAENLNTTVGDLIGENEAENMPLVRKKDIKLLATNEFGADVFSISNQGLNKIMDTFIICFPEKSNSMGLFGKQSGQIFCYLVKGELEFELDHQTYMLEEGDSVYFNARRNFRFLNSSKYTAELLCVTSFKNISNINS